MSRPMRPLRDIAQRVRRSVGVCMSISLRRACGAIVLLFLSASAVAQTNSRLDDIVLRNGYVSLDYAGTDAGVNGTGLRLQPLGRWSDARGNTRFTIWRVRNASTTAKSVRIEASGFSLAFSAKPKSESYVRSPVVPDLAHRLFSGSTLVDTQLPGTAVWSDSLSVARTSGSNHA